MLRAMRYYAAYGWISEGLLRRRLRIDKDDAQQLADIIMELDSE